MTGRGRHIAIVGAGFSGSLLAVHLLRRSLAEDRIYLIERNAAFGRGLTYATGNPGHLLNVRAGNMSAFSDQPDHFLEWLQSSPEEERISVSGSDARLTFASPSGSVPAETSAHTPLSPLPLRQLDWIGSAV